MSDLYWPTDEQMTPLEPYIPKSHGKPRVDDLRVLSGIIFVNRNGLHWRDAPAAYGPHKTLYNRWKRWSDAGVFIRMMEGLSGGQAERRTVMVDATYIEIMFVRFKDWRRVVTRYAPMPDRLPLCHSPRRYRALLATSPEPRPALAWAR